MNDSGNDQLSTLRIPDAELRSRLEEAENTLEAIKSGEVDALIIGDQVYTLESAQAESSNFRGEILAQINDMVIAVDDHMRITYINPAAERAYGLAAKDVLGRRLEDQIDLGWLSDEDQQRSVEALSSEGYWFGENTHRKKNGEIIHIESAVSVIRNRHGKRQGLLAVIRDITERKNVEAALKQAHDVLEERVAERTAELAEANHSLKSEITMREDSERQRLQLLKKVVSSQEDERGRISREIHDQLGQRITALRMQIEAFADALRGEQKFARRIEILKSTSEALDDEVGFLAWELRPASLDDLGLAEAAREFVKDWSSHYNVPAQFNLRGFGSRRLAADTETHLYRIMQESLNNVVKHAEATQVSVLMEWKGDQVTLIIEDDGKGFSNSEKPNSQTNGHGLGLLGMQERAMLVGGTLEVESSVDLGTTIYARVPARQDHDGDG